MSHLCFSGLKIERKRVMPCEKSFLSRSRTMWPCLTFTLGRSKLNSTRSGVHVILFIPREFVKPERFLLNWKTWWNGKSWIPRAVVDLGILWENQYAQLIFTTAQRLKALVSISTCSVVCLRTCIRLQPCSFSILIRLLLTIDVRWSCVGKNSSICLIATSQAFKSVLKSKVTQSHRLDGSDKRYSMNICMKDITSAPKDLA